MTLANLITLVRILLVPLFLVVLLTKMQNREVLALAVFLLAALSDSLDGWVARKYNQITDLGKFLDPLADKLLVAAALIALVSLQRVDTWVAAVIILREIFITAFRFYFLVQDSVFAASWIAKKKTMIQMISVGVLIICEQLPYPEVFYRVGTIMLYVAVALTIYSGAEYVVHYARRGR